MSTMSDLLTIRIGGDRAALAHKKKNGPRPANNRIKSTKYTVITFLPQNLLEQFRRIANFYFLVMVIIATVIGELSGYILRFSWHVNEGMACECMRDQLDSGM